MTLDVAVIGTGPDPEAAGDTGYAMGYRHASAYRRIDDCRLVACVDIVEENARAFADQYDLGAESVYTDHETMLESVSPDLVSVCTPANTHAHLVADCAVAGVDAIHCEKPMASTWGDCKRMAADCENEGVALTINHQRRFAGPFRQAKALLDGGRIGGLERIEFGGKNLYDFGTHLFDLCQYYTEGATPEWVRAILVYDDEDVRYGVHNENRAMSEWSYDTGVAGFAETGVSDRRPLMTLVGSAGRIEIGRDGGPSLRVRGRDEDDWTAVDTGMERVSHVATDPGLAVAAMRTADDTLPGPQLLRPIADEIAEYGRDPFLEPYIHRALQEVVDAALAGRESVLGAETTLTATELIFGSWESARRRERVDLPLEIEDNPLEAMVDEGRFTPS